jgi:hypothetical protein
MTKKIVIISLSCLALAVGGMVLIERGADPNPAAADGMTFAKMLTQHRAHFARTLRTPPEFAALWDWAEKQGTVH